MVGILRGMVQIDTHMHTPLCGHSIGEPREFVDQALQRGFRSLTFTCHVPMEDDRFNQEGTRMRHAQLPTYLKMVQDAQTYGRDKGIEVLCGIEAEIHPDSRLLEGMFALIESHDFDFVIGSLHHMLPAYREHLDNQKAFSDPAIIECYFSDLATAVASGRYDTIGHPDVIRLYGTLSGRFDPRDHFDSVILPFVQVAATSRTCLEINTSGRIKGDFVAHPDPVILEAAIRRGAQFTIGSDSHRPESIGQYFNETLSVAQEFGLQEIQHFKKRTPESIRLQPA